MVIRAERAADAAELVFSLPLTQRLHLNVLQHLGPLFPTLSLSSAPHYVSSLFCEHAHKPPFLLPLSHPTPILLSEHAAHPTFLAQDHPLAIAFMEPSMILHLPSPHSVLPWGQ